MKAIVRKAMQRVAAHWGYEMRQEPSLDAFLRTRGVDLVLDVGANEGHFGLDLRKGGYKGRIHSFEPVTQVFSSLREKADKDPMWKATRTAVGSAPGEVTINISGGSVYSSIRDVSSFGMARDQNMRAVATEKVSVVRLDDIVAPPPSSAIFLKTDTQGFEREVLEGARQLLGHCVGLQLELPIAHIYDGVWDFNEAIEYVKELGFVPAQFRTVSTSEAFPASAVEVDCVFRRLTVFEEKKAIYP